MKPSDFDHIAADGTIRRFVGALNASGIVPFDHRVLLLHDTISDKFEGTSLLRPDQEKDKQKHAQTKATVIAMGDLAWAEAKYDADRFGLKASFPEVGSRVLVGRYAGNTYKGADGKEYTVVNDEDVIAFLESEGA